MDIKYGFFSECWEAEAGDPALIAGLIRARADELLDYPREIDRWALSQEE